MIDTSKKIQTIEESYNFIIHFDVVETIQISEVDDKAERKVHKPFRNCNANNKQW